MKKLVVALAFVGAFCVVHARDTSDLHEALERYDDTIVKQILGFREAYTMAELQEHLSTARQMVGEAENLTTSSKETLEMGILCGLTGFSVLKFYQTGSSMLFLLGALTADFAYAKLCAPLKRLGKAKHNVYLIERAISKNKNKRR